MLYVTGILVCSYLLGQFYGVHSYLERCKAAQLVEALHYKQEGRGFDSQ